MFGKSRPLHGRPNRKRLADQSRFAVKGKELRAETKGMFATMGLSPDARRFQSNGKSRAHARISIDSPRGPETEGLDGGAEWIRTIGTAYSARNQVSLHPITFLRTTGSRP